MARTRAVAVVIAAVLASGVGGVAVHAGGGGPSPAGSATVIFSAAQDRTLQSTLAETGTLGHKTVRTIRAATAGQVSAVDAEANTAEQAGQALFSLNGRTAVAEQGTVPFFRPLGPGDEGADVRQLNQILSAAGDDPGPVGPVFTDQTLSALARWQAAEGYPDATPATSQSVTMGLQPGNEYDLGHQTAAGLVIEPAGTSGPVAGGAATGGLGGGALGTGAVGARGLGAGGRGTVTAAAASSVVVIPTMQITGATTISPGGSAVLTVTSSAPVTQDTQVFVSVGGTAVAGTDYQPVDPVLDMPAGASSATVPVVALASQTIETTPRYVVVALSTSPTGAYTLASPTAAVVTISPASGSATIPSVTLSSATTYLQKGKPFPVTIGLSQPLATTLTINLNYSGTAVQGVDYTPPANAVTVPPGQTSVTLTIPTVSDDLVEPDRQLTVSLAPSSAYDVGNPSMASVDITDTRAPMLHITGSTSVLPGQAAVLTVVADQAPVSDTEVLLQVAGDAVAGTDYASVVPAVVIPAGQTTASVHIDTLIPQVLEPVRHIVVSLQPSPSGSYTLDTPSSAVVTLVGAATSTLPQVSLTSATTYLQKGKPYQVTVSLAQGLTVPLVVNLSYGGTAQEGVDFTPPGGQVVIPAGQTSVAVTIPTVADNVVEADRVLTVALAPSPTYLLAGPASASVTITSLVVPTITVTVGSPTVTEGGSAVFTISADQAPTRNTSVSFTMQGTAQPGRDYLPLAGTVVLPAGQRQVTVVLQTVRTDVSFQPTDMIVGQWPIRVGEVYVKVGDSLASGSPVLDLTQPDTTVVMQASASDRTQLQVGQSCTMTISGGQTQLSGTITELDSEPTLVSGPAAAGGGGSGAGGGQGQQQVFQGVIEVTDLSAAESAADGAGVSITVVVKQVDDALTVPIAAVKQSGSGRDVVRVVELPSGRISEVPVTTGLSSGSYIQVTSGLRPGQTVVVDVSRS